MTEDHSLESASPVTRFDSGVRRVGGALLDAAPFLEPALKHARATYGIARIRLRATRHAFAHDAPIDPFELHWVDPDRIATRATFYPHPKFRFLGAVRGGDWDRRTRSFEDWDVYRGFRAHFEDGVPWEDTEFYDRVLAELDAGYVLWGCENEDDFRARCRDLDRLYETLREDGYRTQRDLDPERDEFRGGALTAAHRHVEDEIAVHVGRSGDLVFADGRNRLTIAKLLDLDAVPVLVLLRHADWQSFRDDVATGAVDPDAVPGVDPDHPDLVDLE